MSLLHYLVDLRDVSDEDHHRIEDLLNGIAETGLQITQTPKIYECFFDEKVSVKEIPGLPAEVIHQIP